MTAMVTVLKVGLAALEGNKLLLVRKRGMASFILPGGKPEPGENEIETLVREVDEELGCSVTSTRYEGRFIDAAAGLSDASVVILLYSGCLDGRPRPQAEIEEIAWCDLDDPIALPMAPSLVNHILPYLRGVARHNARC